MKVSVLVSTFAFAAFAAAQNCQVLPFLFTPVVASGYRAQLVANNLRSPRGIAFDTAGNLLVTERGAGISRFQVGSCGTLQNRQLIISDTTLNHAITISADGRTIFASSVSTAWSWSYDPSTGAVSNKKTIITGMNSGGHSTRTLYAAKSNPDLILASWGSIDNLDWGTTNINSGRSQIRGFSISGTSQAAVAYTQGTVFGWGLRNSVGIGEDLGGGIWSVENSADNIVRNGQDVHNDNPAEELNYHGLASDTTTQRANYGYPECLAVWSTSGVPNVGSLQTGNQFSNGTGPVTDAQCAQRQAPRLSFPAHTAPLDVKFDPSGNAWVSFHGSWNRSPPDGYRVSLIPFGSNNQPVAASNSRSGYQDIMTNPDNSKCPSSCFRPVGLAFDSQGRLFISSDSTNEIYLLEKTSPSTSTTTIRTSTTTSRTTTPAITTTSSRTTTPVTTTPRTTTTTPRTTTPTGGNCAAKWGQCGGISWTGSTCCVSGSSCSVLNPYYSQCL